MVRSVRSALRLGLRLAPLLAVVLAAFASDASAETDASQDPTWDFRWKNSFALDRSDGAFSLRFGGRIHNDYTAIGYTGLNDADGFDSEGVGAEFRRVRLFFKGLAWQRLIFKFQYDFADGDNDIKDMYVGLRFPEQRLDVLLGQHKQPFSFEGTMSSNHTLFIERPTQGVFLGDKRDVGVTFQHDPNDRMHLAAGAYVLTDDFGESPPNGGFGQENDRFAFSGRLSGAPILEDDGRTVLHLGAGYAHWIVGDPDYLPNFDVQPENHMADDFIQTGDLVDSRHVDFVNGEVVAILDSLMLQSEAVGVFVTRRNGMSDPQFWGIYGQVSYLLTGEHHQYKVNPGIIGRLNPNQNFNPSGDGWGAWEVVGRLSYTDASDDGVRAGEVLSFTTGVNWYLFPNARLMFNYVHAHRQGTSGENGHMDSGSIRLNFQF